MFFFSGFDNEPEQPKTPKFHLDFSLVSCFSCLVAKDNKTKQQNKNNNNLLLISRKERRRENSSEMKLYPWNLGMDFHTHKQEFNVPG